MLKGFLAVGISRNRWLGQCSNLRLPHYCGNGDSLIRCCVIRSPCSGGEMAILLRVQVQITSFDSQWVTDIGEGKRKAGY